MNEAGLRELEERRLRALVAADMETAGDLHADDYELITPGGRTISKAEYLDAVAAGELQYRVFESESSLRVRLQERSGTVRYVARIEVDQGDQRFAGRYWHTDIWEERGARWQAVWSHATRIPDADSSASPAGERLTEAELARRAGATPERIGQLVEIGVLRPADDGSFVPGDVQRAQIVAAFEDRGIELEHIGRAIAEGRMSFELTDRIYPAASSPAGRTLGELMTELGERGAVLPDIFLALGRPRPEPERELTEADERVLRQFFDAWVTPQFPPEAAVRAARLLGDAARRAAEGWVDLFNDELVFPRDRRETMRMDELGPQVLEPAVRVAAVFEPMAVWLLRHHLEQALNASNIETMERSLEAEGLRSSSDREAPAIVFADLSGYTRLTEEHGDVVAARHADTLAHLALVAAVEHGGRLVKQLGDGVMLAFPRAATAVEASVGLVRAAREAALPELHIGISAGPVIERDGDYFGRTVNLASRLSAVAGPGEIVLEDVAADAAGRPVLALGPIDLKGLPAPVPLFRLETDEAQ